ncbi:MAG: peptidoglycan-associated lipoprotein Pal [Desulfobacterales bacterium]|jgi:peptidoglycan-associated lipoprotein|nr:peptidoglycan-associated lipoprotein Pal [Desulfobacteraceae bacterium]
MQKHWTIMALVLAVLVIFFTVACSKKKISSEPVTLPTAEEEAARRAQEEARQRELERQKALAEENLKEDLLTSELAVDEKTQFENEDIYFDFDSIQLTPQAQEILTKKAKWLRDNPAATVTIEGHCDNRGTNEYNLALGEGRAQSAKTFLMDLGVDVSKLRTISYGEERPLDPQQTESAWAKNRRAHFVIEE